jgi:nucleotide-binding universal stress UspA family protein
MPTTLVLGYDASDTAKKALAQAAGLAAHLDDGEVFVVSAFEFTIGYVPMGMAESPLLMSAEYDQHVDLVREACEQQVAEAIAELKAAGVKATGEAREGRPVDVLLDAARAKQAAAIVVGSHGESAVSAAFLGSTALKLLHQSWIPVLVVPKREEKQARS